MSAEKKNKIPGRGKKYSGVRGKVEFGKRYSVVEAFDLLSQVSYAKFDETVEVAINLGVDPKQSDQGVRGAVVLPHGVGKSARVAVIAKGDKAKDAEQAGADFVGSDDLIDKIVGGWLDFDKLIATPDMMAPLSKVARILGPKGLMPNPKLGTVTMDVKRAVEEQKKGKVEFRAEKSGIVHVVLGKKSFGPQKLRENFAVIAAIIMRSKPPTSKGVYLRKMTLSSTMSPGIGIDVSDAVAVSGS